MTLLCSFFGICETRSLWPISGLASSLAIDTSPSRLPTAILSPITCSVAMSIGDLYTCVTDVCLIAWLSISVLSTTLLSFGGGALLLWCWPHR